MNMKSDQTPTIEQSHPKPDMAYFNGMSLATLFTENTFPFLAYRIASNEYVTKDELKRVKGAHKDQPIPDIIREYEERLRRGEIKRPGRPKGAHRDLVLRWLVRLRYPKILRYIQVCWRKKVDPWKTLRAKNHYEGPPHEIAAQVLRDLYMPNCDWRHVLDIAKGSW